ncbi:hypothetical protein QJS10_CPA10g01951 [Acorus calamus]|uniref:Uncharacterized protein n=1 Tax=Acorus calamus TaxID=4465 RepID=A0AAV9DZY2_ACOCL|nr:hypothetical protein QJS10_CPA10g01951 [Acorus calamus]
MGSCSVVDDVLLSKLHEAILKPSYEDDVVWKREVDLEFTECGWMWKRVRSAQASVLASIINGCAMELQKAEEKRQQKKEKQVSMYTSQIFISGNGLATFA